MPDHLSFDPNGLSQKLGQIATATADIQTSIARLCAAPLDCHPFPNAMLPKTERLIQLIVDRSNAIEQVTNSIRSHASEGIEPKLHCESSR